MRVRIRAMRRKSARQQPFYLHPLQLSTPCGSKVGIDVLLFQGLVCLAIYTNARSGFLVIVKGTPLSDIPVTTKPMVHGSQNRA